MKDGDYNAFTILSDRYIKFINFKASSFNVPGLEDSDFVQEGLLSLYICAKTFDSSKNVSFKTFAHECIKRRMISLYRSANSGKSSPLKSYVQYDEVFIDTPSDIPSPEQKLINDETFDEFHKKIISSLSDFEYKVLVKYVNNPSYEDIATALSSNVKSVDNALQRIRRKIKNTF